MTEEEKKNFCMNRNIKLSPSLIGLTWDVIFVWTISTLFFTQVKGLSNSQTILLDSILMISGCLLCVPIGKLFQNVSSVNAVRLGLVGYGSYLLLCIFGNNFATFIIAQPFLSFGYVVMGLKTNSFLIDSLSIVKKDRDYQRIYGKGLSLYYVYECVGAIFITYVYDYNPYLVYWISLLIVVLTFVLTMFLKNPRKYMDRNVSIEAQTKEVETKQVTKRKPDSYLKILKSSFFICLLVYAFFMRGILSISSSSYKIYLNFLVDEKAIPIQIYGCLFAISRLIAALASKSQFKFNLKYGVKSLIIYNVLLVIGFVATGLVCMLCPTNLVAIIFMIIIFSILGALRTPNQVFLNNYLQVCTNKKNQEKAHSIKIMVEYLGFAIISSVYASLLSIFKDNLGLTNLVYIAIFVIPLIVSLFLFIRVLINKYAKKFTVVKDEYVND